MIRIYFNTKEQMFDVFRRLQLEKGDDILLIVNDGYINLNVCVEEQEDSALEGYVTIGIFGTIIEEWNPQQAYQRVAKFDEQLINDVRKMIF